MADSLVDTKLLGKPEKFSGKDNEFLHFKFHVIVYTGLIDRRIPVAMKRVPEFTEPIEQDDFTEVLLEKRVGSDWIQAQMLVGLRLEEAY